MVVSFTLPGKFSSCFKKVGNGKKRIWGEFMRACYLAGYLVAIPNSGRLS